MKRKHCLWFLPIIFLFSTAAQSQDNQIRSLDQLLNKVKQHREEERALSRKREAEFVANRNKQKSLLQQAEKEFLKAQEKNNPLKKLTDLNKARIERLEKELETNKQQLGDIYGIYYEFAGDFSAVLQESMITAQLPGRQNQLQGLASRDTLPGIEQMESLWLLVMEEMSESAKITSFEAPVVAPDGKSRPQTVLRAGTFTAVSEDAFVRYIPETMELLTLSRQPRELGVATDFANRFPSPNPEIMIIDPTRGSLLGINANLPTLVERVQQGREVGYVIIGIGILGCVIIAWRLLYLSLVWSSTRRQLRNIANPARKNPLGRIIQRAGNLTTADEETLRIKLDEAILQEIPRLETGHSVVKLFAAVAPLLGLLGTVVGMIATFQAIAIFGSGDPKLMAGGISQALITTVLGLVVAIPLLFGHNLINSLSRSIVQILDEQSAGLLALHLEQREHFPS
jgi:biopolymer transport protein ExbB